MIILEREMYTAFGLNISSDITLPELNLIGVRNNVIDLKIVKTELVSEWLNISSPEDVCLVIDKAVWIHIPNIAIFKIIDGKNIFYTPLGQVEEDLLRLYILGSCMGAVLLQRGIVPLHGSAVEIDNKAYAIIGDSGAGKSTLAAALLMEGFSLISDDIIPLTLEGNHWVVHSAYPQQKLWQESLEGLEFRESNYKPIANRENKYSVPVFGFQDRMLPLGGIFELCKGTDDQIHLQVTSKIERLHKLYYHTYRNFLVDLLESRHWHFESIASISDQIPVYQLNRPSSHFTAKELANMIKGMVLTKGGN